MAGYYFRRHIASEVIVMLSVMLSRYVCVCVCVCVCQAAYITYQLHATLVLAVKVMRRI